LILLGFSTTRDPRNYINYLFSLLSGLFHACFQGVWEREFQPRAQSASMRSRSAEIGRPCPAGLTRAPIRTGNIHGKQGATDKILTKRAGQRTGDLTTKKD